MCSSIWFRQIAWLVINCVMLWGSAPLENPPSGCYLFICLFVSFTFIYFHALLPPHLNVPKDTPPWMRWSPGHVALSRWCGLRKAVAFSGNSCAPNTARKTCCSGLPARNSRRRQTLQPSRRKPGSSTRTTSPFCHQKRYARAQESCWSVCMGQIVFALKGVLFCCAFCICNF